MRTGRPVEKIELSAESLPRRGPYGMHTSRFTQQIQSLRKYLRECQNGTPSSTQGIEVAQLFR
jgi:hypothetical protein